jgi:hypothetical protein
MPRREAAMYATALNEVSKIHALDPLLLVAIVDHESHWRPSEISPDGEDYGLGQVRARFLSGCRDDEDPVGAPSEACMASKARLLDGAYNIRHIAAILSANRALCVEKTGSAAPDRYLAGYQGLNRVEQGRYCEPGAVTAEVLGYQRKLLDKYFPAPHRPTAKKGAPAAGRKHGSSGGSPGKQAPAAPDGKAAPHVSPGKQPPSAAGGKSVSSGKQPPPPAGGKPAAAGHPPPGAAPGKPPPRKAAGGAARPQAPHAPARRR